MTKAVFLFAPSGWGKSEHKKELAEALKCRYVADDTDGWDISDRWFKDDTLYLGKPKGSIICDWLVSQEYVVYQLDGSTSIGAFLREMIGWRKAGQVSNADESHSLKMDRMMDMYERMIETRNAEISAKNECIAKLEAKIKELT